jgi:hypothetical protein
MDLSTEVNNVPQTNSTFVTLVSERERERERERQTDRQREGVCVCVCVCVCVYVCVRVCVCERAHACTAHVCSTPIINSLSIWFVQLHTNMKYQRPCLSSYFISITLLLMQSSLSRTILLHRPWNGKEMRGLWTRNWQSSNLKSCLQSSQTIHSQYSRSCDRIMIQYTCTIMFNLLHQYYDGHYPLPEVYVIHVAFKVSALLSCCFMYN